MWRRVRNRRAIAEDGRAGEDARGRLQRAHCSSESSTVHAQPRGGMSTVAIACGQSLAAPMPKRSVRAVEAAMIDSAAAHGNTRQSITERHNNAATPGRRRGLRAASASSAS